MEIKKYKRIDGFLRISEIQYRELSRDEQKNCVLSYYSKRHKKWIVEDSFAALMDSKICGLPYRILTPSPQPN